MTKAKRNSLIAAIISAAATIGYQFLPPQYKVAALAVTTIINSVTGTTTDPNVYTIPQPDPLAPVTNPSN